MKKHEILTKAFPDKLLVKVASVTKDGGKYIGLKECWLYSAMIWRFGGKPVSKLALSNHTNMNRTRTLPKLLANLERYNLVIQVGGKYKAIRATGDIFKIYTKPSGKQAISYDWAVYSPSRSIIDGLVEAADTVKVRRAALLAIWFGCTAKTITAARKRLAGLDRLPTIIEDAGATTTSEEAMPHRTFTIETVAAPNSTTAERLAAHFGIETPDTIAAISRLIATLPGLASSEHGEIMSALNRKYGTDEALEDYLAHKMPDWSRRYYTGATLDNILSEIEVSAAA